MGARNPRWELYGGGSYMGGDRGLIWGGFLLAKHDAQVSAPKTKVRSWAKATLALRVGCLTTTMHPRTTEATLDAVRGAHQALTFHTNFRNIGTFVHIHRRIIAG